MNGAPLPDLMISFLHQSFYIEWIDLIPYRSTQPNARYQKRGRIVHQAEPRLSFLALGDSMRRT